MKGWGVTNLSTQDSIEGNPFIIRFKTLNNSYQKLNFSLSIEGNPFIIRFKTNIKSLLKTY